jgi:hypothetical protein
VRQQLKTYVFAGIKPFLKSISTPESLFFSQKIPRQARGSLLFFAKKFENANIGINIFFISFLAHGLKTRLKRWRSALARETRKRPGPLGGPVYFPLTKSSAPQRTPLESLRH